MVNKQSRRLEIAFALVCFALLMALSTMTSNAILRVALAGVAFAVGAAALVYLTRGSDRPRKN